MHIINHLPSPLLHNHTPYLLLFNKLLYYTNFKSFCCLPHASKIQQNPTKFDHRSHKCVFLGYQDGTKGYLIYNLSTNNFFVSRNICLYELHYPFSITHDHLPLPSPHIIHHDTTDLDPFLPTLISPPHLLPLHLP